MNPLVTIEAEVSEGKVVDQIEELYTLALHLNVKVRALLQDHGSILVSPSGLGFSKGVMWIRGDKGWTKNNTL